MNVLLVDDDQSLVRVLRQGLVAEGFTVSAAHDGTDGLRRALAADVDVIVLDVMLPELDGQEVLRSLRSEGVTTPVLLLTARDAVSDRVSGLEAGADDYLTKPFAFAELLARIRARARRPEAPQPSVLTAGGVTLDLGTREVRLGDAVVSLGPTEFRLLEHLMRHPGQVLPRASILHAVWGYSREPVESTIDLYVHQLRLKLGRDIVQTVRGIGYRLGGT